MPTFLKKNERMTRMAFFRSLATHPLPPPNLFFVIAAFTSLAYTLFVRDLLETNSHFDFAKCIFLCSLMGNAIYGEIHKERKGHPRGRVLSTLVILALLSLLGTVAYQWSDAVPALIQQASNLLPERYRLVTLIGVTLLLLAVLLKVVALYARAVGKRIYGNEV